MILLPMRLPGSYEPQLEVPCVLLVSHLWLLSIPARRWVHPIVHELLLRSPGLPPRRLSEKSPFAASKVMPPQAYAQEHQAGHPLATTLRQASVVPAWSKLNRRVVLAAPLQPRCWIPKLSSKEPLNKQSHEAEVGAQKQPRLLRVVPDQVIEVAETRGLEGLLAARPLLQPKGHSSGRYQSSAAMYKRAQQPV